ncbi:hypothetical protein GQ457_10G007400 [Hibiscus cannabinus]
MFCSVMRSGSISVMCLYCSMKALARSFHDLILSRVLIKVPEPSSGPAKTSDFDPGGYTSLSLHGGGTSRRLRERYPESDPIPYTEVKTSRKVWVFIPADEACCLATSRTRGGCRGDADLRAVSDDDGVRRWKRDVMGYMTNPPPFMSPVNAASRNGATGTALPYKNGDQMGYLLVMIRRENIELLVVNADPVIRMVASWRRNLGLEGCRIAHTRRITMAQTVRSPTTAIDMRLTSWPSSLWWRQYSAVMILGGSAAVLLWAEVGLGGGDGKDG